MVCRIAVFILANNLLNTKPDVYLGSNNGLSASISLMCFEKHTCILRKHSVSPELISLISLQLSYKPQRSHTVRNSVHLHSKYYIFQKCPRCVCVVCVSLHPCVIVTVWLNVRGQAREFVNLIYKFKKRVTEF